LIKRRQVGVLDYLRLFAQNSANSYFPLVEGVFMRGETRERWIKLCQEATTEQDAERLLELA
jgi:hypothetical protein